MEILGGIILGIIIIFILSPYFNLWKLDNLSEIADELKEIQKEMRKINEGLRERNRLD